MESTAAKMEYTSNAAAAAYTRSGSLADRVKKALEASGGSVASLAEEIGYARPTLSQYLSGKYSSNAKEIELRLRGWLAEQKVEREAQQADKLERPKFYESRDAKAILGVCQSCQEYIGLGIVVGRSGYGKTHTLKQYAKLPRVAYIECDDTMSSRDLVEAIEDALGIPKRSGTIWSRVNGIRNFCNINKGYLIIIDEADKLVSKYTQKKMEILRGIYDQADVGLVIAGEPQLEVTVKNYLTRMANRVDFYASLGGLKPAEVEAYLSGCKIDPAALSEIIARACNKQTGCFRLLDRTMNNVTRILQASHGDTVTLKVIEQASSMMML